MAAPTGTLIHVTGSNFDTATSVTLNGTVATISANDYSRLSFAIPSGATTGNIVITNSLGTATSSRALTVNSTDTAVPSISSLSPTSASRGQQVTVLGLRLGNLTTLTLNGTSIPFQPVSASQLTFTVPANGVTGTVVATNNVGASTNNPALTVTSFLPFGESYVRPLVQNAGNYVLLDSQGGFVDAGAPGNQGYDATGRTGDMFPANSAFRLSGVRVVANNTRDAIAGLNPNATAVRYPDLPYLFYVGQNGNGTFVVQYRDSAGNLNSLNSPTVNDGGRFGIQRTQVPDGNGGYTYPISMFTANGDGSNLQAFVTVSANDPRAFYVGLNPSVSGRGDYTTTFGAVATN